MTTYNGGAEALVNTNLPGDQYDPQVTMLENGGWVITWTDPNDGNDAGIFQQAYNADGSPLGAQTQVNTLISRRQIHSEVAATPDGGWIVTYTGWDSDDYGVYKQAYNADGSKNGVETLVNTTTTSAQAGSSISVLGDGSYVITWASLLQDGSDGAGIYQQLYSANGAKIGGETAVNTTTAGHQVSPNVAILANGGYVISWTQANGDMISGVVYSQMFDATGAKVGSEHSHAVSALGAVDSQVTGLADGGYVVTWITQQSSGSIARGAFAQIYNADGSERGAEITVSSNLGGARNDGSVMQPDVLGLPNGDFIVVWTESDSSGRGVFGQVYNADGTVDGASFSITADATFDQMEPQIVSTGDGGFKVVWRETGVDNFTDIYTRTFSPGNNAPGAADATLTTLEDKPYVFKIADFGFSDPDGDALGSVTIDSLPASGSLTLNGVAVTAGQVIAAADIGSLVWTPATDANGDGLASFAFTVSDAKGAAAEAPHTITFNVTAVADPIGYEGGAEKLVNTTIPGDQSDAQITMLKNGGWVITWTDPNDGNDAGIFQQAYNADGSTLGAQTQVNTLTSGRQIYSEVAALSDGGWIVTYTGWDSNDYGVYKQVYNADGSKNGVETLVNTTTTWGQARPSISVLADGSYVIAWASHLQDVNDDGAGIYQQLYSADGSKIGGETAVNTTTAGNQTNPNTAVLANGGYVVSWTQANGDMTAGVVYSQMFDGTGAKIGSEHSHAVSGKGAVDSQVTGLADGGYVVTWANQQSSGSIATGVFAQAYNADGSERGAEITVSSNLGGARNDWSVMQPDVLGLPNGDFIVVWTQSDSSGRGVFGQVYNADGTVDGSSFTIIADATSDQMEPQIVSTGDGGFKVVWREVGADNATDIYTRTFNALYPDANTAPTGADATLTTLEDEAYLFTAADFGFSDADGDELGGVTIDSLPESGSLTLNGVAVTAGQVIAAAEIGSLVWTPAVDASGEGLASFTFTVVDANGKSSDVSNTITFDVEEIEDPIGYKGGDEVRVNTTIAGDQWDAQVTMLADGGWVVTWTDPGKDGNDNGVFQQAYDAEGAPLGAETQVNTATHFRQFNSQVAALPDGGWIVTYTGWDSNDYGIYKQAFNADGTKNGVETLVNTTEANSQAQSAITVFEDGGYAIAWASHLQDGDATGIYQQLYNADGTKNGVEVQVNTTTLGNQIMPNITALASGGYVVSWTQASDDMSSGAVYSQMFDDTGAKIGSEHSHAVSGKGAVDSQISGLADGGYVVTWANQQSSGSIATGVFAQAYNADGTERGAEITVSANLGGAANLWSVMQPDVLGLPNGDFIIVWTQGDSSGRGVFGQVYNSDGTVDGASFMITADATSDQMEPQITATDDGFMVVWREFGGESTTDVYSRRFSAVYGSDNAAPTGSDTVISVLEDDSHAFSAEDFGFSDDDGDNLAYVTIETLPENGALTLNGEDVGEGDEIAAEDLGDLVWTPEADANGENLAELEFSVTDDAGSTSEETYVIGFDVEAVNDAPTSASKTLTTLEDTMLSLSASDFAFNDVDSEMLASITIDVLPENGTLTLNGEAVSEGDEISADDLGGLAWTPDADANGDELASFQFTVTDEEGASSEDSYAITFDVAAVNDAPTGANKTVTINEDMSFKLTAASFGFSDVEGDKFSAVKITTLPSSGELMLAGKAVKAGQAIDASKLSKLVWTPDENDAGNGLGKIGFQVIDNGGSENGGVDTDPTENILTINVKEVRDVFTGTSKANRLTGTGFADTLDGKGGKDTLTGKGGADAFVFGDGYGKDKVTDFAAAGSSHDIIDLSGADAVDSFAELKADHMVQKGANVLIDLGEGDVLTLLKVKLKTLTIDHFDF